MTEMSKEFKRKDHLNMIKLCLDTLMQLRLAKDFTMIGEKTFRKGVDAVLDYLYLELAIPIEERS